MMVIDWKDFVARQKTIPGTVALTIGVFDGIHSGHKRLLRSISSQNGSDTSVLVTFRQNPLFVLGTKRFPGNILSPEQKLVKLETCGIHHVLMIDFSHDFSKIAGDKFIETLTGRLLIRKFAAGYNFALGHKREVDVHTIPRLLPGVEIEIVQPVYFEGEVVSSTRIRNEIIVGNFTKVKAMLGDDYSIEIPESTGASDNRRFLIVDRELIRQVVPGPGRFRVKVEAFERLFDATCVISENRIVIEAENVPGNYSSIKNIIFTENEYGRS